MGLHHLGRRRSERTTPQRSARHAAGVVIVGGIYVSMNVAYVYALPGTEVAKHETIAHAAAVALFSSRAAIWLSAMIAVSCFGAAATCTLSGAAVSFTMKCDGAFFRS